MPNGDLTRGGTVLADAVRGLYRQGQSDYLLEPIVLADVQGKPIGRIQDGDVVVFCCRRGEREIQLTEAFVEPGVDRFPRRDFQNLTFVLLTLYHEKFKDLPVAFAPTRIEDSLGEIISRAGLYQLRVAESEKFAHVTFFFNGGNNQPFVGEDDVRIPSPKGIPVDQVPELSLVQVAEQVLCGVEKRYDLIVANFANGDVIGHTQNRDAKIKCAELVDARLGQTVSAALAADYVILVTADHGNLEDNLTRKHTRNLVPGLIIGPQNLRERLRQSLTDLTDITPAILELFE